MDEIIEEYLKFIQLEKGLSENTIGAYRRDLKKYQDYLEEERSVTLISSIVKPFKFVWVIYMIRGICEVDCPLYFYDTELSSVCA